jgi:phosphatidate cytidylyltransferase
MHRLRVLSALLLLLPFLAIVQFASPLYFHLVLSAAIFLCAWEFAWLCPMGAGRGMAALVAVGSVAWQWALIAGLAPAAIAPAVAVVMLVRALGDGEEFRTAALRAAWAVFGVAYVGGLFSYGSLLREGPDGRQLVYFVALTTWAGDIGAYYVGSRLGRRPLAPRVSPKKTVEGALGGVAATVLIAALGSAWVWPRLPVAAAIWVGGLLAVVGMVGDLAESVVKRAAGVKDSGTIIPGHGGILDRLDSVIFCVPALYGCVWMGLV